MATATITTAGLYNFNDDLFQGLHIPDGLDSDTAIFRILMRSDELEVLYTNPDTMQQMIDKWSSSRLPVWNKLYASTQFDYNPIWNKDGTITETETGSNNKTDSEQGGYSDNLHTESESTDSSVPFENTGFKALDKTEGERTDTNSGTRTNTTTSNAGHSITRTRRETGNIGITTTQQMIKEEREVVQLDLYSVIADEFVNTFCLLVY
jgi:hypothetical protein